MLTSRSTRRGTALRVGAAVLMGVAAGYAMGAGRDYFWPLVSCVAFSISALTNLVDLRDEA